MGRNRFNTRDIATIERLLEKKCEVNRFQQKLIRHRLRTEFGFNISDFNIQGKAFGAADLKECIRKGIIKVYEE